MPPRLEQSPWDTLCVSSTAPADSVLVTTTFIPGAGPLLRTMPVKAKGDPAGPAEGQYHVIRGSGWRHASISELRMAYRDFGDRGRLDVGFRIARYLPDDD